MARTWGHFRILTQNRAVTIQVKLYHQSDPLLILKGKQKYHSSLEIKFVESWKLSYLSLGSCVVLGK